MTAGPDDGSGAMRAMKLALRMGDVAPEQVDYVNAHATSTPVGDAGEIEALKTVFGVGAGPAISSTKSATGHLLGAAGAIEAAFSILALRDGVLPGTLNLEHPDPAADGLDLIGPAARRAGRDRAVQRVRVRRRERVGAVQAISVGSVRRGALSDGHAGPAVPLISSVRQTVIIRRFAAVRRLSI
jgi:hypothetical protein